MKTFTRRTFARLLGASAALAGGSSVWPKFALGGTKPRVVVLGGGAGGAIAASYLARNFKNIDVTLIEANRRYTACFFASRYLGGLGPLAGVTHGYETLAANNGISVIHATATGIDGVKKAVVLNDGARVPYDRLIAAPGIGFKYDLIDGYDEKTAERFPHAYLADA